MKKKFTIHLDNLYDCLDTKNNTAKTQYGCVKYESISRADGYNYFSDTNDTSDPDCMDKETAELMNMTDDYAELKSEWGKNPFRLSKTEFYYALSELPETLEELFGKEFLENVD